jgi:hypothetical protein
MDNAVSCVMLVIQKHQRKKVKILEGIFFGEIALGNGGITAFTVSALALDVVICVFLTRKNGSVIRKIREGHSCRFQTNKVPRDNISYNGV